MLLLGTVVAVCEVVDLDDDATRVITTVFIAAMLAWLG